MHPGGSSKTESKPSVVGRFQRGRRRDAQDQIEAWMVDATSEFGRGSSSRVSAQPPKNVTEQKMLESKLFEMSKQRYNFILHARWQQKLFMEKQRQKTAVMKDLLKNVDLSKLQSTSGSSRDNRFQLSSVRTDRSRRIPTSNTVRTADEMRTVSPATVMTGTDAYQKKTVTFVTERPNLVPEIYREPSGPISAVRSANLPEVGLPPIKLSRKDLPEIFSISKGTKAYILPLEGRWPVKDARFVKLSQALSENYPAVRRRQASKALV